MSTTAITTLAPRDLGALAVAGTEVLSAAGMTPPEEEDPFMTDSEREEEEAHEGADHRNNYEDDYRVTLTELSHTQAELSHTQDAKAKTDADNDKLRARRAEQDEEIRKLRGQLAAKDAALAAVHQASACPCGVVDAHSFGGEGCNLYDLVVTCESENRGISKAQVESASIYTRELLDGNDRLKLINLCCHDPEVENPTAAQANEALEQFLGSARKLKNTCNINSLLYACHALYYAFKTMDGREPLESMSRVRAVANQLSTAFQIVPQDRACTDMLKFQQPFAKVESAILNTVENPDTAREMIDNFKAFTKVCVDLNISTVKVLRAHDSSVNHETKRRAAAHAGVATKAAKSKKSVGMSEGGEMSDKAKQLWRSSSHMRKSGPPPSTDAKSSATKRPFQMVVSHAGKKARMTHAQIAARVGNTSAQD